MTTGRRLVSALLFNTAARREVCHFAVLIEFLESFFFQVVDIEPVVNDAVPRNKLGDVILHILLSFGGQIA
jgi:hypothetical protein